MHQGVALHFLSYNPQLLPTLSFPPINLPGVVQRGMSPSYVDYPPSHTWEEAEVPGVKLPISFF